MDWFGKETEITKKDFDDLWTTHIGLAKQSFEALCESSLQDDTYSYLIHLKNPVQRYFYYRLEYLAHPSVNCIKVLKRTKNMKKPMELKIINPKECVDKFDLIFLPNTSNKYELCDWDIILSERLQNLGWYIVEIDAKNLHILSVDCFSDEEIVRKKLIYLCI